ncbi:uncharacterized protein LOC143817926 isoform X2 [Ranitomeya variabilis]
MRKLMESGQDDEEKKENNSRDDVTYKGVMWRFSAKERRRWKSAETAVDEKTQHGENDSRGDVIYQVKKSGVSLCSHIEYGIQLEMTTSHQHKEADFGLSL